MGVQGAKPHGLPSPPHATALACVLLGLAACGNGTDDGGVVAWWHRAEGGPIAQQRPPPPNVTAPYPKLSVVPPRPKSIDPADRAQTYAALASDRADATYEASQDPLAAAPPRDENGLFAPARPAPPPSTDAAGAALDAAAAKPAPPAAAPPPDAPTPDIAPDINPPPVPDQPPPQPRLAGVSLPVTIPHLPPKAPAPRRQDAPLTAAQGAPLAIPFPPGSAVLPQDQRIGLRNLAFRRGLHGLDIIGFGEAEGEDPQSQIAGVQLGLQRARAVAAVLIGDGSPEAGIHLAAQASGQGAAARLTE